MTLDINKISTILKNSNIADRILDIIIDGNIIIIKIYSNNPAMHDKINIENNIKYLLKDYYNKYNISIIFRNKININKILNTIAVSSCKGGVGKSTICSNLAISLKNLGLKVGLLDADVYGPSIPIMFDCENEMADEIKFYGESRIKPVESYGIKLMSIGFFLGNDQPVVWRGPMVSKAINQMINQTYWDYLDILLIDMPPGTGDIHLSLMQSINVTGYIIISTPQRVSISDVKKGINMLKLDNINIPILGVIENMSFFLEKDSNNKHYIYGKDKVKLMCEQMNVNFLGNIPLYEDISYYSDVGIPCTLKNITFISNLFNNLALSVIESLNNRNKNLPPSSKIQIKHNRGCSQ